MITDSLSFANNEITFANNLRLNNRNQDSKTGICLVTGETGEIARTHGRTPINKDTKCLVSFQKNCGYDSYGKEQGYNAPVIKSTEFAYVTALNTLLKTKSQRMTIGDASTVFWSEKKTSFEADFALFFSEPPKDDPALGTRAVKALFESPKTGAYLEDEGRTRLYVLGLAPNAARTSAAWGSSSTRKFQRFPSPSRRL